MSQKTVLVLVKRSSYRRYVQEGREKDDRIAKLLEAGDPLARSMQKSHADHVETLDEVRTAIARLGAAATFVDGPWNRIEGSFDLAVTVGGDGTLLAASHDIGADTPILGINSAPSSSVGFFCGVKKGAVLPSLGRALRGELPSVELSRMLVEVNGARVHSRVLNETLFCHASPAATSRFVLRAAGAPEEFLSSGVWIGPAAGSTAAQRSAGGGILPLVSTDLQYVIREPYVREGAPPRKSVGRVAATEVVELRSKMHDARIFFDGHHTVHTAGFGDLLTFRRSDEPLTVLGLMPER